MVCDMSGKLGLLSIRCINVVLLFTLSVKRIFVNSKLDLYVFGCKYQVPLFDIFLL